jgi:hypothetical protein
LKTVHSNNKNQPGGSHTFQAAFTQRHISLSKYWQNCSTFSLPASTEDKRPGGRLLCRFRPPRSLLPLRLDALGPGTALLQQLQLAAIFQWRQRPDCKVGSSQLIYASALSFFIVVFFFAVLD